MSLIYREATWKDREVFHKFLLQAYAPIKALGIHFLATEATQEDIDRHLLGNLCFLLEKDGVIVSSCSLRLPWGLLIRVRRFILISVGYRRLRTMRKKVMPVR